ncbi:MAG: hemolysin family protein [Carbonactinosporaceae bacterium]
MSADIGLVVSAIVLVVVAGVFVAIDTAISRISRSRVEELVRSRRHGAVALQRVLADPPRYLNLTLLIRAGCELLAAVLVTVLFLNRFPAGWQAVLVATAIMVVVSYIVVGVSPRTLGRQHDVRFALAGAAVLLPLVRVLGPLPQLLILIGNALTPGRGFRDGPFASEAELREFVDLAEQNRLIEEQERRMVHSVFELGDTIVREVMVPRMDMVFIEKHKTLRQALSLALRSGFSRIPVVGENEDDVIGIVYLKDLALRLYEDSDGESTERVESAMRPPTFVPDSKPADELLREMQAGQIHMAVVVDEYGGTAGIVTIEDILEEIVGDITDEYDREKPAVAWLPDGSARVSARLSVQELAELFGVDIEEEDVDTVGGLLAKYLGRVPILGARAEVQGLTLTAESAEGRRNRLGSLLVAPARLAAQPEPDDGTRQRAREHA